MQRPRFTRDTQRSFKKVWWATRLVIGILKRVDKSKRVTIKDLFIDQKLIQLIIRNEARLFFLGHAIDSRQGHLDNLDEFPDEGSRVVVGRRSGRATSKGFRVGLHSWRAFHYRVHRFQGHLLHLGKLQREYPPQSE